MAEQQTIHKLATINFTLIGKALGNAQMHDSEGIFKGYEVLREFVLSPKNGELIWRSAKVAHSAAGISQQDFSNILEGQIGLPESKCIADRSHVYENDPYRQLGLTEWIKYIYYSGSRKAKVKVGVHQFIVQTDAAGNEIYADDQDILMRHFGIIPRYRISNKATQKSEDRRDLYCNYSARLYPLTLLRNKYAGHSHMLREETSTLNNIIGSYLDIETALRPLATTPWIYQRQCVKMLDELEAKFYSGLGPISYQIADIIPMMQQLERNYYDMMEQVSCKTVDISSMLTDLQSDFSQSQDYRMDEIMDTVMYRLEKMVSMRWQEPDILAKVEALLVAAGVPVFKGSVEFTGDLRQFVQLLSDAWWYYQMNEASGIERLKIGMDEMKASLDESKTAIPEEKSAASLEQGDSADWLELADRYRLGIKGVEQDNEKAVEWYQKAAVGEPPMIRAFYEMGRIYERKDSLLALSHYRKAANLSHAGAQVRLGQLYESGTAGVKRNWAEAAVWYGMAARQDDPMGLCKLGMCYQLGRGVQKDYQQASSYFLQAQIQGCDHAKVELAFLGLHGYGVPKDEANAIRTLQELAKNDFAPALAELGKCYLSGIGVKTDLAAGFDYISRAAKAGDPRGQYLMGYCHQKGIMTKPDAGIARQWYFRAARQGHIKAQLVCADKAKQGERWLRELAAQNHVLAQEKLAQWYLCGRTGIKQDEKAAVQLLQTAKDASDTAKILLAHCYLYGIGIEKDPEKARVLAEEVVAQASGQERMCAEGLLATFHEQLSNRDNKKWLYWADRAARHGHVRWALKLVETYFPKNCWTEDADLKKALTYFELAAQYGNSSLAWAFADYYHTGHAYVPPQACTDRRTYHFVSPDHRRDPLRAQYWYRVKCQREISERVIGWRYWDYWRIGSVTGSDWSSILRE